MATYLEIVGDIQDNLTLAQLEDLEANCENPEPEVPAIPCDSCECVSINGVACHESGCPEDRQYIRDLKRYENFECQGHGGLTVNADSAEEFETEDDAENACSRWHSRYTI